MRPGLSVLFGILFIAAILAAGCAQTSPSEVVDELPDEVSDGLPEQPSVPEVAIDEKPADIEQPILIPEEAIDKVPQLPSGDYELTEQEPAPGIVVEGEGNITKAMCPEQVLIGLRDCTRFNGFLNISVKNQLSNVSMVFYYIYDKLLLSEEHSSEVVASKETRSYIINLDSVEAQYGEVRKIEITPVYSSDGKMTACTNKKLPVIVKQSCN